MEYSNKLLIRSSQQPFLKPSSSSNLQRKFLTRRDLQLFYVHAKRNYPQPNQIQQPSSSSHHSVVVNSAQTNSENSGVVNSVNTDNVAAAATSNHLVAQPEPQLAVTTVAAADSWLELVLSLTFAGIVLLGVILVGVVLYHWLRRHFRESAKLRQQSDESDEIVIDRECVRVRVKDEDKCKLRKQKVTEDSYSAYTSGKMNSRKWLSGGDAAAGSSQRRIESRTVDDLEQRLETVKFKSSPPTSPSGETSETAQEQEDDDAGCGGAVLISCPPLPLADFHPQPTTPLSPPYYETTSQSPPPVPSSPLALLSEAIHSVQPSSSVEEKSFKSIATSPAPFSPQVHHSASFTTIGTQTYFTKAPNSPNNHVLSTQFAVLQTPTTSHCPNNPFAALCENKENKEPLRQQPRQCIVNKTITSLRQDNAAVSGSASSPSTGEQHHHYHSSASSPASSPPIATSPKILGEQNQTTTSPDLNKFTHSPKTASTALSPSLASATSYSKFGNYFRFPDVGTPPVTSSTSVESSERENIILKIDEVDSPPPVVEETPARTQQMGNINNNINNNNNNNTLTIRRARLKSISLDSDGARLVGENLTRPVEEIVEMTTYKPSDDMTNNDDEDDEDVVDDYDEYDNAASMSMMTTSANNNNDRINPKNIFNLTINLNSSSRESSLDIASTHPMTMTTTSSDVNMNNPSADDDEYGEDDEGDEICRTPTMKYFAGKKAVSLDSDHHHHHESSSHHHHRQSSVKTVSSETFQYYFGQSGAAHKLANSISVPSTPKHLTSNKLKISASEERSSHQSTVQTCTTSSSSQQRYGQRKLGSFEDSKVQQSQQCSYKSNLTTSIQTLNVSSSNLKTLPEISSISDFEGQSPKSVHPPQRPMGIPPSKSGILQRRGSNTSLTLNLNGSTGNLTRGLSCSNYSLGNINGSNLNISGQPRGMKKTLLQRRGSNTSLTLNVQDSNSHLNRFNSHSSLNIAGAAKQSKGLLERRNSNASLTLNIQNRGLSISNFNLRGSECSLSSVNTNQMAEIMTIEHEEIAAAAKEQVESSQAEAACHQRKFRSSENLHNLSIHRIAQHPRTQSQHTPYGSIDNLKQHTQQFHQIPVICTKPLSPQSTSEDFKIYLANIQFLQSASNVLNAESLLSLNQLFQNSYKSQPKVAQIPDPNVVQFYNDDVLNSRTTSIDISTSFSPDEDQKEKLIKLHHEFWNLPTNYQEKPMVFGSQPKNRYKTILPNEHSRVILQREEGCGGVEPYINANYIKGPDFATNPDALHAYIATQGPMTNTVYEFWLMTKQNVERPESVGIQKIIMLTDFVESARQKCARYFPTESDDVVVFTNSASVDDEQLVRERIDQILHFEGEDEVEEEVEPQELQILGSLDETAADGNFNYFVVRNLAVRQKNGYSIRKLRVYHGTHRFGRPKEFDVYHYWFPDWPDHRSPEDIDVLLDLSLDILDGNCLKDFDEEGAEEAAATLDEHNVLPIIHCSAGIGRTGCLAAILNGLRQIRGSSGEVSVDILGIVCNLRLQRGGMVQNSEQYELIHRSICLYQHKISTAAETAAKDDDDHEDDDDDHRME